MIHVSTRSSGRRGPDLTKKGTKDVDLLRFRTLTERLLVALKSNRQTNEEELLEWLSAARSIQAEFPAIRMLPVKVLSELKASEQSGSSNIALGEHTALREFKILRADGHSKRSNDKYVLVPMSDDAPIIFCSMRTLTDNLAEAGWIFEKDAANELAEIGGGRATAK